VSPVAPALFPAIWLGLGADVSRWDPLTDEALLSGSAGLGVDVADGLWLEARGGWSNDRAEPFPTAGFVTSPVRDGELFEVDPGLWGDARLGVCVLRGTLPRPGSEPLALRLSAFVGAGALEQRERSLYGGEPGPATWFAATSLAGASFRARWPGRVAPELDVEAYDRAWLWTSSFKVTVELQHDLAVGAGARLVLQPARR